MSIWSKRMRRLLLASGLIAAGTGPALRAATAATIPVRSDPESLHDAIADAWSRMPQRAEVKAAQSVAAARFESGGALFPDAPYGDGEYDDDRAGSNDSYRTTRIEFGTPVWLPGEGTATQHAAVADGRAALAGGEAAHFDLARQVLDLAVRARLAQDSRDAALSQLRSDQALSASAADRFRVGEGAQSDALAADAASATDMLDVDDAKTSLGAALIALSSLTGHDSIPVLAADRALPDVAATGTDQDAVERNPQVVAAAKAVEAAEAHERLVRVQDRADPELGLQVTNDKQPGSPWDTRLGVVFHLPFASAGRNAPLRAAASQEMTRAVVQLALARRAATAALGEARLRYAASARATVSADRAATDLQRRQAQIRRAWTYGETPLIEVMRADSAAFAAVRTRDRARTQRDAAAQRLVLASGRMP